jgi:formate dehydrogenase gamma subunit
MSERQMHWAVAVPFMVCYVTAVVLISVYNPNPHRPLRALVSWTHRVSGLCLFVLPVSVMIRHWYDVAIHLRNIQEVWRWTMADLKWLLIMGPAQLSKKIVLPEQGKFNAAEKINFMVLTATVPLYLCTGLMIWSHQFAFPAWIVHFAMATAATPLMFGHVFMATVNPDTRVGLSGMITGFVDRHWASHHYGVWYRANFAEPTTRLAASGAEALLEHDAVSTRVTSGVSADPARSEPRVPESEVSPGTPPHESPRRDPRVEAVPALVSETQGSPWTGQFEPAMACAHCSGRMSRLGAARAVGGEDWEREPLPPFMRPVQPFDRARARWLSMGGTEAVTRPDSENA